MKPENCAVMILGAGLGTRLRPITNTVPKVMVPIANGLPLLEHTITLLKGQGFREFIINLHYLPEVITNHFGDGKRFGINIVYSDETQKLFDTAGAIKKVEHLLSDDFVFMYGDELHFFDFRPLLDIHTSHNALATIVLKKSKDPANADLAELDDHSLQILRWYKRPHRVDSLASNMFGNAGLYILSKKIANNIPAGIPLKLDGDILPELINTNKEKIYGFVPQEPILDIGTLEKYEYAKKYYQEKTQIQ